MKGETNFVADALSRPSVSAIGGASVINYKELSEDQGPIPLTILKLRLS